MLAVGIGVSAGVTEGPGDGDVIGIELRVGVGRGGVGCIGGADEDPALAGPQLHALDDVGAVVGCRTDQTAVEVKVQRVRAGQEDAAGGGPGDPLAGARLQPGDQVVWGGSRHQDACRHAQGVVETVGVGVRAGIGVYSGECSQVQVVVDRGGRDIGGPVRGPAARRRRRGERDRLR